MEIYANFRQKVTVDPIDVIEKLVESITSHRGWITEEEGKFYRNWEVHKYRDDKEEITKEQYEYYKALRKVEENLKENK